MTNKPTNIQTTGGELGAEVKLKGTKERGQVIGFAEYLETNVRQYLVRYVAGDGRLVESWWSENALEFLKQRVVK